MSSDGEFLKAWWEVVFVLGFEGWTGLGAAPEPSVLLGFLAMVLCTPLLPGELRVGEKEGSAERLFREGFLGEQLVFLTGQAVKGQRGQGLRTVCGYLGPWIKASSKGLPQRSLEGAFWGSSLNQQISALWGIA